MKTAIFLSLALFVVAMASVFAQSQAEMNADAAAGLEKADRQLNAVYQKLLKSHEDSPAFCSALKEAQRAWLRFVEFHLKSAFPLEEGEDPRVVYGSIFPMEYALLKTQLTEERVAQLRALAEE